MLALVVVVGLANSVLAVDVIITEGLVPSLSNLQQTSVMLSMRTIPLAIVALT